MNKCQSILIVFLLLQIGSTCFAQQLIETIYTKNGSVIKGVIVETVPNKTYKIQTNDGSIIIVNAEDVERITKNYVPITPSPVNTKSINNNPTGPHLQLGFSLGGGFFDNTNANKLYSGVNIGIPIYFEYNFSPTFGLYTGFNFNFFVSPPKTIDNAIVTSSINRTIRFGIPIGFSLSSKYEKNVRFTFSLAYLPVVRFKFGELI